jgi:hypothetical protein
LARFDDRRCSRTSLDNPLVAVSRKSWRVGKIDQQNNRDNYLYLDRPG